MNSIFRISCIAALCLFANPISTSAQIKTDTLKEVHIQAKKIPGYQESTNPVQILDANDLQKINSATVADVVKRLSGVQLKDYGGIGGLKTINVRSLGSNHTGIYYDGVPILDSQNGEIDLGKFSLDNIEQIALYNGQSDAIFQPASLFASGSALFLQSKTPSFANGQKSKTAASLRAGSFGLFNPSVRWQQKIKNRVFGAFNAEWKKANGHYYFHEINGSKDSLVKRTNTDIDALRLELDFGGLLADSSQWRLKAQAYQSQRGLPGAVIANRVNTSDRLWNDDSFIQGSYEKNFARYRLKVNGKYAHNFTRYLNPSYLNADRRLDNQFHQNNLFFSAANQYQINHFWNIDVSADYIYSSLDANLYQFVYPRRNTGLVVLASEWHFDRLNIQANMLSTLVSEHTKSGLSTPYKKAWSPSLSASWQPFAPVNLHLRGFYKDVFRLPTFNDLYYTLVGNVNLRPEYAKQYNLGVTYTKGFPGGLQYLSFHADVYHNRIKDKITAIPTANLFRWSMINLGLVQTNGLETGLQSAFRWNKEIELEFGVNYTYQNALDITPGGYNYRQQIPYTPKHAAAAFVGASYKTWQLGYNMNYTGERYSQKENIALNLLPAWTVSDVNVSYRFSINKMELKLIAEVDNFADKNYAVVYNYPMPGRSYRLTLNIQY